jgi:hypothetical protein
MAVTALTAPSSIVRAERHTGRVMCMMQLMIHAPYECDRPCHLTDSFFKLYRYAELLADFMYVVCTDTFDLDPVGDQR